MISRGRSPKLSAEVACRLAAIIKDDGGDGASQNTIMEPNKARGRVMRQDVRGKRFEPKGLGMFHGMKEKVRRSKGRQCTGP